MRAPLRRHRPAGYPAGSPAAGEPACLTVAEGLHEVLKECLRTNLDCVGGAGVVNGKGAPGWCR